MVSVRPDFEYSSQSGEMAWLDGPDSILTAKSSWFFTPPIASNDVISFHKAEY